MQRFFRRLFGRQTATPNDDPAKAAPAPVAASATPPSPAPDPLPPTLPRMAPSPSPTIVASAPPEMADPTSTPPATIPERDPDLVARLQRDDRAYFGRELFGTSNSQREATTQTEKLVRFNLPLLASEHDIADWLEISLSELRWYTQDRPADTTWHYIRFTQPKRSGGERVIMAPKPALKQMQRKILSELVGMIPVSSVVHGFVPGRSTVTNASQHVGKAVVLRIDLKDFFPSISFARVRGLFIAYGYSFAVASTLALLCTEYEREPYEREGKTYYVSIGPRHLVQGAPTSPGLANLIAWRLDRRLQGLAQKVGYTYTRYADDLVFSGDGMIDVQKLRGMIYQIVADEHFTVNVKKTRIARQSTRQVVTGLVVNERVNLSRTERKRLRALYHNIARDGIDAQNHAHDPSFPAYIKGMIAYVHAVNPTLAERFKQALPDNDAND